MPAQLVVQRTVSFTSSCKTLVLLLLTEMQSVALTEADRVNHGSDAICLQKPLWCGQGARQPAVCWGGSC